MLVMVQIVIIKVLAGAIMRAMVHVIVLIVSGKVLVIVIICIVIVIVLVLMHGAHLLKLGVVRRYVVGVHLERAVAATIGGKCHGDFAGRKEEVREGVGIVARRSIFIDLGRIHGVHRVCGRAGGFIKYGGKNV